MGRSEVGRREVAPGSAQVGERCNSSAPPAPPAARAKPPLQPSRPSQPRPQPSCPRCAAGRTGPPMLSRSICRLRRTTWLGLALG